MKTYTARFHPVYTFTEDQLKQSDAHTAEELARDKLKWDWASLPIEIEVVESE